jgi:phosphatidylinositol alpha-1,6-mannosyltransferase
MGFDVLLRAFVAVHRRRQDAVLILAGQGPHRRRLERLAGALPSEVQASVRWEAAPGRESLRALYRRARVVAVPRLVEGGELAVAGAMAAGRAVIVTEAGGFPVHAINGGNALVVPADDAASLSEAILSLLENPHLCEKIARAGQAEAVRSCSWVEAADRYLGLFRNLSPKN